MLHRKAYDKFVEWKNNAEKTALCVIGARQIGKTTLIREFGRKNYAHFVEVNFVTDQGAAKIFVGSLDADTLITNLSAYTRKPMEPGKTLVLYDEVQECLDVRIAIKFLDFTVQNGLHVELIEVTSGKEYKKIPLWIRC